MNYCLSAWTNRATESIHNSKCKYLYSHTTNYAQKVIMEVNHGILPCKISKKASSAERDLSNACLRRLWTWSFLKMEIEMHFLSEIGRSNRKPRHGTSDVAFQPHLSITSQSLVGELSTGCLSLRWDPESTGGASSHILWKQKVFVRSVLRK